MLKILFLAFLCALGLSIPYDYIHESLCISRAQICPPVEDITKKISVCIKGHQYSSNYASACYACMAAGAGGSYMNLDYS